MSSLVVSLEGSLHSTSERYRAVVVTRAVLRVTPPAVAFVVFGLLVSHFSREEVYANLEYGFPMLALFGAAGCIGQIAFSISRGSEARTLACCILGGALPVTVAPGGVPGGTSDWPVLLALLFGPLVVLLSGLGGWV